MEISEVTLFVIGLAASIIVWGIKTYQIKSGKDIPTVILQWLVYGVSLVLALIFQLPVLPEISFLGSPVEIIGAGFAWIGALLTSIAPAFTFATLVYTTLLKSIMEKLTPAKG